MDGLESLALLRVRVEVTGVVEVKSPLVLALGTDDVLEDVEVVDFERQLVKLVLEDRLLVRPGCSVKAGLDSALSVEFDGLVNLQLAETRGAEGVGKNVRDGDAILDCVRVARDLGGRGEGNRGFGIAELKQGISVGEVISRSFDLVDLVDLVDIFDIVEYVEYVALEASQNFIA